jgi:hypothetical protein
MSNFLDKTENENIKTHPVMAWVWLVLAIIYILLPVDGVPDVPVFGWVDDLLIGAAAVMNLIQNLLGKSSIELFKIVKIFKWILIALAVIVALLAVIAGTLIFN